MYIDFLMILVRFWSSHPLILKFSTVTELPVVLLWSCIEKGAFRCSLKLSQNVLEDSPMYYLSVDMIS